MRYKKEITSGLGLRDFRLEKKILVYFKYTGMSKIHTAEIVTHKRPNMSLLLSL